MIDGVGLDRYAYQGKRGFDFAIMPHAGVTHDLFMSEPHAIKFAKSGSQFFRVIWRGGLYDLVKFVIRRGDFFGKGLAFLAIIDRILLFFKGV